LERARLFNYIDERLRTLANRIAGRSKLNLLDLNLHSENFYANLLNLVYGWSLENENVLMQNAEAIDLADSINHIVVQVSSTNTKAKIEATLSKDLVSKSGWSFKFVSIAHDADPLRKFTFKNPHQLQFTPTSDILDVTSILRSINALPIDKLIEVEALIRKELRSEVDPARVESGLAAIIKILAKENWGSEELSKPLQFSIDAKIQVNNLNAEAKIAIEDYSAYHSHVDKIYSEYNKQGSNKSLAILNKMRSIYAAHKAQKTGDELFTIIITKIIDLIQASSNYQLMPIEELELCVNILAVDAFVRCKIFENPAEAANAPA